MTEQQRDLVAEAYPRVMAAIRRQFPDDDEYLSVAAAAICENAHKLGDIEHIVNWLVKVARDACMKYYYRQRDYVHAKFPVRRGYELPETPMFELLDGLTPEDAELLVQAVYLDNRPTGGHAKQRLRKIKAFLADQRS